MPMADTTPSSPTKEPAEEPPVIYSSRPPDEGEELLIKAYYERFTGQSKLMDDLAKQMITVELAVPGLYATALALLRGKDATLALGRPIYVAFGGWALALLLTLAAVFPRHYKVDPSILRADPNTPDSGDPDNPIGIMDYFERPARRKWELMAMAAVAFWAGLIAALCSLLAG